MNQVNGKRSGENMTGSQELRDRYVWSNRSRTDFAHALDDQQRIVRDLKGSFIFNPGGGDGGSQEIRGDHMKKKIVEKQIVKDIARGLSDSELTQNYNLSREQLRSVFKQLANVRGKRIQTLASDLRSGMARSKLMTKYQLSSEALASSRSGDLRQMLSLQPNSRLSALFTTNRSLDGLTRYGEKHPIPVVTICEAGKPGTRY